MDTLKILFKFPCRGRKDMFFESLESIHNFIADKENYHVSLTLDTDDEILNKPDVVEKINEFSNTSIEWGLSESKIHAINRSMPDYDWDVIICWSQDMFAKMYGFDQIIREGVLNIWGDTGLDGLAHFPEPDSKQYLNVLYIATRKYYERFGYIYHPSYKSLWCDNESMEVANKLGSTVEEDEPLLKLGSIGQDVIELQQKLTDKSFSPGAIDGDFGENTKQAVIAFQRSVGLTADGIVGPRTRKALGL